MGGAFFLFGILGMIETIIGLDLLMELPALRESVFVAADQIVEKTASERVQNFTPTTSLSDALHQVGADPIDVDEVLRLSNDLEI